MDGYLTCDAVLVRLWYIRLFNTKWKALNLFFSAKKYDKLLPIKHLHSIKRTRKVAEFGFAIRLHYPTPEW